MERTIKCLVWDLDNTIWDGTLLETDGIYLRYGVEEVIRTLDARGIIQSIASKNNYHQAMTLLKEFNLDKYFIFPEINWNAKSNSINNIRKSLNISSDSIAFIDDQPFEREEVNSVFPEVYCLDASEYHDLVSYERFMPEVITEDAVRRRMLYQQGQLRDLDEKEFKGPTEAFLAGLGMELFITTATEGDLLRAEELTQRTNQLNATGKIYSYDELKLLLHSTDHQLIMCELKDKYGSYGKIGLALLKVGPETLHLEMMLFSCRVSSRGIGTVVLHHLMQQAKRDNRRFTANFIDTGRNRLMYLAFKFAGFNQTGINEGYAVMESDLKYVQPSPHYIKLITIY